MACWMYYAQKRRLIDNKEKRLPDEVQLSPAHGAALVDDGHYVDGGTRSSLVERRL